MSRYPCSDCGCFDGMHRHACSNLRPDRYEAAMAAILLPPSPATYASETHKDRNAREEQPA